MSSSLKMTCQQSRRGIIALAALACALLFSGGCASVSNPVAQGVPVHRLPPEYLAPPKENLKDVPLTALRQEAPESHLVDKGDVLGLFIEGVVGEKDKPPPVHLPDEKNPIPATGFPYVVNEEGKLTLPQIPPLLVKGMTITEVRDAIIKAYVEDRSIIQPAKDKNGKAIKGTAATQILVSLLRPRHERIQVVRQDSGLSGPAGFGLKRGSGATIELRAYENDVLHALTATGGTPGLDAINEVRVQRGSPYNSADEKKAGQVINLPLRVHDGDPIPFKQEDVILKTGDIVFIKARDTEVYYTGGLVQQREFVLPRDYDMTVVTAISLAGGPLVNGGIQNNNLSGNIIASGLGSPSPSAVTVLRKTKEGGQIKILVDLNKALNDPRENIIVQTGDVIILQETLGESITRYFSGTYHLNLTNIFSAQKNLTGINTYNGP
jgi:protein involved in polysaccharide export with SLBB domain